MKYVKISTPFGFALLSIFPYRLFGISGTSKVKEANPAPDCKITAVNLLQTDGRAETVRFRYDKDVRVKFIYAGVEAMKFFYEIKGFRPTTDKGNGWSSRSFVALNAAGSPITRRNALFHGQRINQITPYTLEYSSRGQLVKFISDDPLPPEQIFTWDNGNLVEYQSDNTIFTLDYAMDGPTRGCCFIDFMLSVSWGIHPAKSKNLLRSLSSNGNQMIFDYRFDDHGNIKDWEATVPRRTDPALRGTQSMECAKPGYAT